jgi:DNA-binding transcriptional LysR family regulator
MPRETMADLTAFLTVAREQSFTRAAAQLGVSPSALSHTVRKFEERVGVRLLNRTTRHVSPTEAGERLLGSVGPHFDEISAELQALGELRDKPAGTVRITTGDHAAETILWPALRKLLPDYPDVIVEVNVETGFTDIVAGRYDAGVRLGEAVAKDMIAVRIGPDMRMVVVGTPAYFEGRRKPRTPQDLAEHQCINYRFPSSGGVYAWEFEKGGREIKVRVEGQLIFNTSTLVCKAVLDGLGLAFLPEDMTTGAVRDGRLVRVLDDWTPPFPGYYLYYPSRRQQSPAFALLVEALRYRG